MLCAFLQRWFLRVVFLQSQTPLTPHHFADVCDLFTGRNIDNGLPSMDTMKLNYEAKHGVFKDKDECIRLMQMGEGETQGLGAGNEVGIKANLEFLLKREDFDNTIRAWKANTKIWVNFALLPFFLAFASSPRVSILALIFLADFLKQKKVGWRSLFQLRFFFISRCPFLNRHLF